MFNSGNDTFFHQRQLMVEKQLIARDIVDPNVLAAMRSIPRHEFVSKIHRPDAYLDNPLPIGHGQTISQPYIVALMTQLAHVDLDSVVLEIGTGCGYQTAVLGMISKWVYSIEIVDDLAKTAMSTLEILGYSNISIRSSDGYQGWPEKAPFDAIVVTAAPSHVPQPLVEQLKVGGKLVIPVGTTTQELIEITKSQSGVASHSVVPVRFVPMTGEAHDR